MDSSSLNIYSEEYTFGQRYLQDENAVFVHNAWDNVDWSEEEEARAKALIEAQKCAAANNDDSKSPSLLVMTHEKWNAFYATHENRFFMDRKWVSRELPEIFNRLSENKRLLLRICCETAKNRAFLERLLDCEGGRRLLKSQVIRSNHYLALALLYDLVLGRASYRSFYSKNEKPMYDIMRSVEKTVKNDMKRLADEGITQEKLAADSISLKIPRYVRLNTIVLSSERAFAYLTEQGYTVKRLASDISQEHFRKVVTQMDEKTVYIDPHVENLLIFRPSTQLYDFWMINEAFILQDKASCLPSILLEPPSKRKAQVMDVCAAPGMKTTHLAALMKNNGKIFAMDRDAERIKTLRDTLRKCGVKNTNVLHSDFLRIDILDKRFTEVSHILVDPPCSGSGMVKRGEFLDEPEAPDERRLRSLANLQCMILKHALRFPNVVRCAYSTCSVHDMENEGVIQEVLEDEEISRSFELVDDPLPKWPHRGSSNFNFGQKCLRASPEEDLTNGFFIAIFQKKT